MLRPRNATEVAQGHHATRALFGSHQEASRRNQGVAAQPHCGGGIIGFIIGIIFNITIIFGIGGMSSLFEMGCNMNFYD